MSQRKLQNYQQLNILRMQKKPIIMKYWKIRGKGHIIRMLLEYLHIPYQDILYSSPQSFFHQQRQIAHMAHNLPFLKDGETEVFDLMPSAIYITRKYNREELMGKNMKDQTFIDMFHWNVQYLFMKLICSSFWKLNQQEKTLMQQKVLKENIEPVFKKIQDNINNQNKWYLGYLSIIDFCLYQLSFHFNVMFPGKLSNYPKIIQIAKNIGEIPEIIELEKQQKIKQLCSRPVHLCRNLQMKFMC